MTELTFRSDVGVQLINGEGHLGVDGDLLVAMAAKVSTLGTESLFTLSSDKESQAGLINFLMKNRHGSPFEHNSFTFLIEAPIFVFREFHRHRVGWSYNEESGRYKQLEPVFYVPDKDRNLIQTGKAGQYIFGPGNEDQYTALTNGMSWVSTQAYSLYQGALDIGIAKEVARMCLPLNIFSSMYATCNARSLMHFLSLRTKSEDSTYPSFPQREIEMVAEKMETVFEEQMPLTYNSFVKNGRVSP